MEEKRSHEDIKDLPGSGLNPLYNTGVQSAEWVTRPKQGMPSWVTSIYPITAHSGVRPIIMWRLIRCTETAPNVDDLYFQPFPLPPQGDHGQFLIHKGRGYGQASQTVVTAAAHMSHQWQVKQSRNFGGTKTVGDFVKTGGTNYSIMSGQHCHTAAKDMMNQGKK